MLRPHFNNIFRRDTGQSWAAQEAMTKVCLLHSEEERRSDRLRLAVSLRVAEILSSRFVYPRRSSYNYSFLVLPCGIDKISRNASGRYY